MSCVTQDFPLWLLMLHALLRISRLPPNIALGKNASEGLHVTCLFDVDEHAQLPSSRNIRWI